MLKPFNLQNVFLLALALFSLISCETNDDGPPPATNTIAEIVSSSANLTTLQRALERSGLDATLQGSGSYTVLAPTNAAFDLFLAVANFPSIEDVPVPVLEQLLLNHVLAARVDASVLRALGKNYTETLADGPGTDTNLALFFDATGADIIFNGTSEVLDADISATNGIVHVVDTVLDFPTLATFVQANDAFEQLALALTTATPGTDFIETLSGTTQYTVFAPADEAFETLLDSNPAWTTVNDIEEGLLTSVLQHHLIDGNVRAEDIANNDTAASLEGDLLTFSTANGVLEITDGSGNSGITVVVGNIQAYNGVLHAIDEVLLPDTTN